jgi:hypothetical protein
MLHAEVYLDYSLGYGDYIWVVKTNPALVRPRGSKTYVQRGTAVYKLSAAPISQQSLTVFTQKQQKQQLWQGAAAYIHCLLRIHDMQQLSARACSECERRSRLQAYTAEQARL